MRTWLHNFDMHYTKILQRGSSFRGVSVAVTTLGHPAVTLGIGIIIALLGSAKENMGVVYAGFIVLATMAVGTFLKLILRRDRPLTEYVSKMFLPGFSFPSGHSVGATAAYGLLADLTWYALPQPWNIVAALLLVLLIIAIGLSRVRLGAHFPSDVLAGWLVGLVGLMIILFAIGPRL